MTAQALSCSTRLWREENKFTRIGCELADGHYSRRKVGAPQFMPPGQTLVLISDDDRQVFGWWRPHPRSGIRAMNNLDGWTCTIYRRAEDASTCLAPQAIQFAEVELAERFQCGPDGLLTYVWDAKVLSENPGYCFKVAGWHTAGRRHACCLHMRRRSADGKKTLLHKPFEWAGRNACGCTRCRKLAAPPSPNKGEAP